MGSSEQSATRSGESTVTALVLDCITSVYDRHSSLRFLPSFPTRRSSDLELSLLLADVTVAARLSGAGRVGIQPATQPDRSEEHTSELQSPYDLVCRLLLEKKNVHTLSLL